MAGTFDAGKGASAVPREDPETLPNRPFLPASGNGYGTPAPPPREPGPGVFLVASPALKDPHFRETVVLIIRHGPFGTFGVIINRPTDIPLSRVWPGLKELKDHKDTLFSGGPVQPDGFGLLFSDKTPPATLAPVFDEVYFSQDSKHFKDLISRAIPHEPVFRVYAGSAGWAPGQLDGELRAGGWILARGFSEAVFSPDPGALWAELIERSKQEWVGPDPAKGAEVRWVSFNPLLMPENSRPVSPLP